MKLSVIIVNYNVCYFLEQCLCSLSRSAGVADMEIIVVDNHSSDNSLAYLKPRFPGVIFIARDSNTGFARANNIGLSICSGSYILFLNPDTILAEDSLRQCISKLETDPGIGALGVRMVDGGGDFLKESKRGFPSPWVSFCKLSGLIRLFPHSRLFSGYYLGYTRENENCPAPVLSGAFMMVRKEILDRIGGFDEQFFMYAEDIDLCARIREAGYLNYYLSETTIIHFKGESTSKDFRYVKLFYKAMSQFTRKYFKGGFSFILRALMDLAIWFRAGISLAGQFLRPIKKDGGKTTVKIFLTGEEPEIKLLADRLASPQRLFVEKEEEADEIIFCSGDHFPAKEIIGRIGSGRKGPVCLIHLKGTDSVVGSGSKKARGEAIPL